MTLAALLCRLADPQRASELVPADHISSLLELARVHGVLPIVLRKLDDQLPPDQMAALRKQVANRIGPMLHLRTVRAKVETMVATGLPARIVKGPVLADMAYANRADRPFSDLDILTLPEAHEALAELLGGLGFVLHRKPVMDHTESNQEQKWVHPEISSLLVEVHGNLVHYAALRRRASFGYPELLRCEAESKALAMFFAVVVHGTLGHKLHELKLLVDMLQTFRLLDANDRGRLPGLARELRLAPETALCLDLVCRMFDVPEASELARGIKVGSGYRLARKLVNRETILAAPDARSPVTGHHLFRVYQYLARR